MRYVVDSNFLRTEDLRTFLSKSRSNTAVLNDYAAMEAYKGDTLRNIFPSMEILADFPEQVIVLKSMRTIGTLSGRTSGLQKRMVDNNQTKEFPDYCKALKATQKGDARLTAELLEHGRAASKHMEVMLADMEGMTAAYKGIEGTYTNDEIRKFRTGGPYSRTAIGKFLEHIEAQTVDLMQKHPNGVRPPRAEDRPNTFIFRFSVCTHLLLIRWVQEGSIPEIKTQKLRNDIIDAIFATFATYFDGLLSKDRKGAMPDFG